MVAVQRVCGGAACRFQRVPRGAAIKSCIRTYQNVLILRDLPRRRLQPGVQESITFASVLHSAS